MKVLGISCSFWHDPSAALLVDGEIVAAVEQERFSGFDESAVLTIDGMGEITTCLFGLARGGKIEKIHEIQKPDSLGLFYAAMTEYLGFEHNDGEYKVMGMASYGDPDKVNLDGI